ncbi:hypothetical protein VOLCADRAFT_93749 [Volvox carteri f. nagariensis]|uniref:Uncharacterized protein n=1 Tax=Volvox carteri f. nagariensis TaxID=3068 RepID=D8U2Y8_VOLCA|nr:uncharacterized protein VOLCADRAFT_93749 [Volvox carteri f. nagariensis]EFJ45887.1 hypothetical protein VOLCADRAFT_93749 [Volvox carteri f. nagariensis]|eukprot:XP_002952965.1 hypothetical protein VOLCADRAFT_93749 [Volvox carteri f. nagariensis]
MCNVQALSYFERVFIQQQQQLLQLQLQGALAIAQAMPGATAAADVSFKRGPYRRRIEMAAVGSSVGNGDRQKGLCPFKVSVAAEAAAIPVQGDTLSAVKMTTEQRKRQQLGVATDFLHDGGKIRQKMDRDRRRVDDVAHKYG